MYIKDLNSGKLLLSATTDMRYPILDKQVFFVVEDPLCSNGAPASFPIIPSNCQVFTHIFIANSSIGINYVLAYNGVEFIMSTPYAHACPTINYGYVSQGVKYYW
ncbi:MAG: hypothetical protein RXR43_14835 [Sulfolobus sp.]